MGGKLTIRRRHQASPLVTDNGNVDHDSFSLTDHERQLIESTWKQLISFADADSEEELGVRVFVRIFELEPAIKDVFPQFVALQDRKAMQRNVMFRCHGSRFVRAVRSVVDNLDALGVIAVPNLDLLGRKHQCIHGFRPDYLRIYEMAMEDVWRETLGRKFDKPTSLAWRKVFKLITSTVLQGYEQKRSCPARAAAAAAAGNIIAATPIDVNGSLVCNDSQNGRSFSS